MKKATIAASILFASAVLIFACKHEPVDPGMTPPGGGTGGGGSGGGGGGGTTVTCSSDTAYFQQQVLPIFISNCAMSGCHDAVTRRNGVQLTDYNSIITTGDVRPFNAAGSDVWERITETDPSKRMPPPPKPVLPQAQKDIVFKWIMQGARNNSCVASVCDTANVTYSGSIKKIMDNKCTGCHSGTPPQGGINFTTYAGVKAKVTDGKLRGAINHLPGFSPMPKGGAKLSDCELKQFRIWMDAGALNN